MHPPINIFSGEKGLGAALTNPTELGLRKGMISERYPIQYGGTRYADVESAYHVLKTGDVAIDDQMMTEAIAAKFIQHPALFQAVQERGGAQWLSTCSHYTNARSGGFQSWEGTGMGSRFIRNLVSGFKLAETGALTESGQGLLF